MTENIKESAEERPELNLGVRRLWCGVIDNAIEDAKGRKMGVQGTKPYRLNAAKVVKRNACQFLKSLSSMILVSLSFRHWTRWGMVES